MSALSLSLPISISLMVQGASAQAGFFNRYGTLPGVSAGQAADHLGDYGEKRHPDNSAAFKAGGGPTAYHASAAGRVCVGLLKPVTFLPGADLRPLACFFPTLFPSFPSVCKPLSVRRRRYPRALVYLRASLKGQPIEIVLLSPAPCASAFSLACGTRLARRHCGLTQSGAGLENRVCFAYPPKSGRAAFAWLASSST